MDPDNLHRKLLGRVAIDSGRLLIVDPGRICGESRAIPEETLAQTPAGPICFGSGAPHAGVVAETHGEELYSVYVVNEDDVPIRIEIDLAGNREPDPVINESIH